MGTTRCALLSSSAIWLALGRAREDSVFSSCLPKAVVPLTYN